MNDMTEQECRASWEKHQKNAHEDDMMPYSEFRSECGLRDEEEEEDAWYDFMEGAKWQMERMYSEEEVFNITQQLRIKLKSGVLKWQDDFEFDLEEWFEQFKNKQDERSKEKQEYN